MEAHTVQARQTLGNLWLWVELMGSTHLCSAEEPPHGLPIAGKD